MSTNHGFCTSCGEPQKDGASFCASCGTATVDRLAQDIDRTPTRTRWMFLPLFVVVAAIAALVVALSSGSDSDADNHRSATREAEEEAELTVPSLDSFSASLIRSIPREMTVGDAAVVSPNGRYVFGGSSDRDQICAYALTEGVDDVCHAWDKRLGHLPTWSPDSRRIALTHNSLTTLTDSDIWVFDIESGAMTNLTDDGQEGSWIGDGANAPLDHFPVWHPDGRTINFLRFDEVGDDIHMLLMGVTLDAELTLIHDYGGDLPVVTRPPIWLNDREIALTSDRENGPYLAGVWVLDVETTQMRHLVAADEERAAGVIASVSPDGRFGILYYASYAAIFGQTRSPLADLLDLRTGDLYPLIPSSEGVRTPGPFAVGFSPDSARLAIAWDDYSNMVDSGWGEMPTSTVSIADLGSNPRTLASSLHTVYTHVPEEAGLHEPLRGTDWNTSATVWQGDDRIVFGQTADLLVLRLHVD